MVIKITDIRNKHEFVSDAEKAAAHEELVAAKVAELKALYASDPKKYKKFSKFDDNDWVLYAEKSIQSSNAISLQSYYFGVPGVENDPELAMWVQYTYEEILQMEAGGVLIPEQVLSWAHSMQDSDVTSYEVDESTSSEEETVDESDDSDLAKLEQNAQKLGEKSKQANEQTNVKFAEFETISKKAEEVKREQEASQKDSLKEIQELTEEYAKLHEKIKKGEQLNDGDKKRYQELNSLLNGKDGELVADLQTSTAELEDLMNSMNQLDQDIDDNIELGDETIDAATKLAEYEKEHKSTNVENNFFINMATGRTLDELYGAKGQSLARDVFDSGSNLIQFSNTLNTTLTSSEYTTLFEFATQFTTDANETLDETRDAMGDNFNKTTEELNGDESGTETPANEDAEKILTMGDLIKRNAEARKLVEKDIEVKEASKKVEKQAASEVEAYKAEQEELIKQQEEVEAEQQENTKELENVEDNAVSEETNEVEDPQESQENQVEQNEENENKQTKLAEKTNEVLDINAAIAESNIEGASAKERLQKATEVNKKYDVFNSETENVMDKTCNVGTASTVYGTVLAVNGANLIVTGVPLLPNPFTHAIGAALVAQGAILAAAGVGYVGIGGSLISIGLKGIDESSITGEQIDLTDDTIQGAIAQIQQMENPDNGENSEGSSAEADNAKDPNMSGNEETEDPAKGEDKLTMSDLTNRGLATKELIEKDIEVREASAKVAEQAEGEVEAHQEEQAKLIKEKKEAQDAQEADADAAAEVDTDTEAGNVDEPENLEEAQETQEEQQKGTDEKVDKQDDGNEKAQEVLDINAAIEASNIEGATAKERLEKATEVNKKYDTFNEEASDIMDKTCNVGALSTVFGGGLVANGAMLISAAAPLLPNPFTHAIGAALLAQGIALTATGTGFVGIGGSLIAIGFKGVDETMITGEQIDLTDEVIQESLAKIEEAEGGEVYQGRSAAEQERFDMRKAGASLPDQARHFKKRSAEETLKSAVGIVETGFVKEKSDQEAKKSEGIAEGIEKRLSGKKEEYNKLEEKKEKFEEQQEKINNAVESGNAGNIDIEPVEQFTTFDEQKMRMLGNQLQMFGDIAQAELFKSLEKVDGLKEFLADKEADALRTIDYGDVAQIVGMQLFDQSKNNILLISRMILGLTTAAAGKGAEFIGNTLDKVVDKASTANDSNINKITSSQNKVEEITMSEAIALPEEGENAEDSQEQNQEDQEEQAPLTAGQSKLKKMQDNGASLPEQALVFTALSAKEGSEAETRELATKLLEAESNKEAKVAEFIGKTVEKQMKDEKAEFDELTEKQKKAEEANKKAKERADAAKDRSIEAAPSEIEKPEEEFTQEDQERLDKLGGKLQRVGDSAQNRLLKGLERIEGLDDFLADFSEEALEAMDYGAISEILGMILYEQAAGNIFLIHHMLLGLLAMRSGKNAQVAGEELGKSVSHTASVNVSNTSKIHQAQQKVAEVTMSEALGGSTETPEEGTEGATEGTETPTDGTEETPETRAEGTPAEGEPVTEPAAPPESAEQIAMAAIATPQSSESIVSELPDEPIENEALSVSTNPTKSNSQSITTGTTVSDSVDGTGTTPVNANQTGSPTGSGLTGAAAMVAGFNKAKFVEQAQAKIASTEGSTGGSEADSAGGTKKAEDDPEKEGAAVAKREGETKKQISEGTKDVASANKEVATASKESKNEAKDSKKTEKQLEMESKNLTKLIEQDGKRIDKLTQESQAAVEEQMLLVSQYEALNAQVEEANARVAASQQSQPAASPPPDQGDNEGGGLLSSPQPQQNSSVQQDIVTINTNQAQMSAIGTRFLALDQKINTNRAQITKYSASINKNFKRFQKVAKAKAKIQKAAQKAELKKQKRMQNLNAAIEVVNGIFSVVSSVGTIMEIVGTKMVATGTTMIATGTPMLSNPFTLAAGLALVTGGTILVGNGSSLTGIGVGFQTAGIIGVAACGLTKAGIAIANGDLKGALMQIATTIVSIAMNFIPGVGSAASAATSSAKAGLQIASASLNIVSSTATVAANSQTLAGKEQSTWLNTTSQVAGVLGSLTNSAAALTDGVKGFSGAIKVIGFSGAVASSTATISTLIKQAMGKDPGEFEEIMGLVGTGLSTAASLMTFGQMIAGGGPENNGSDNADSTKENAQPDQQAETDTNPKSDDPAKALEDPKVQKQLSKAQNIITKEGTTPQEIESTITNAINNLPADKQAVAREALEKLKKDQALTDIVSGNDTTTSNETQTVEKSETTPKDNGSENDDGANPDGIVVADAGTVTGGASEVTKAAQAQAVATESIEEVDAAAATVEEQNAPIVDDIKEAANNGGEANQDPQEEEPKLTRKERKAQAAAEEEAFRDEVKEQNGFTDEVKKQTVDGQTFEVTEDGKFLIDGEEVSTGEMHARMTAAKAESAKVQQEFTDLEVGGVKEIDGNVFEKQADGSYKLVKGYNDDMSRQLSDETFTGEQLFETTQMTEEQRTQWQQEKIDPIKNPQNTETPVTPPENEQPPTTPPEGEVQKEPVEDEVPTTPKADETGEKPPKTEEETTPPTTPVEGEVPTTEVTDEVEVVETPVEKQPEAEVLETEQPATETPAEELTPEQKLQQQVNQVAEQAGLTPGKSQTIDGHTFEITKKGECLIDGQKVHPGEMKDRITIAKSNSDKMQLQLANCKDGESVVINGQEFIKQAGKDGEEPTFKLVKEYDQDFKQETLDTQYSQEQVMEVGNMSQEDSIAWADKQIKNEKVAAGFQTTTEVLGKTGELISSGMQMASTIESLIKDDSTQKREVLHLSNMKKGKALMRKIKRKQNVAGFNRYN